MNVVTPPEDQCARTVQCEASPQRNCESSVLRLECAPGQMIQVISAFYGRLDDQICPDPLQRGGSTDETRCYADAITLVDQCDGQQSCDVASCNDNFGDPCKGVYKYTQVDYICTTSAEPDKECPAPSNPKDGKKTRAFFARDFNVQNQRTFGKKLLEALVSALGIPAEDIFKIELKPGSIAAEMTVAQQSQVDTIDAAVADGSLVVDGDVAMATAPSTSEEASLSATITGAVAGAAVAVVLLVLVLFLVVRRRNASRGSGKAGNSTYSRPSSQASTLMFANPAFAEPEVNNVVNPLYDNHRPVTRWFEEVDNEEQEEDAYLEPAAVSGDGRFYDMAATGASCPEYETAYSVGYDDTPQYHMARQEPGPIYDVALNPGYASSRASLR